MPEASRDSTLPPTTRSPPGPGAGAGVRLIVFGFLLTFLSSFGQTFFIGLFSDDLRETLQLGDGAFGTLYSTATVASALCVFWAGALIDRIPLRTYLSAALILLIVGCVLIIRSHSVVWLGVAFFLLRFAGQGLLTHTAATTLARRFTVRRGRALSFALLGHPTGEAILPVAAVALAALAGWRSVWLGAGVLILLLWPLLLWLPSAAGRAAGERPPEDRAAASAQPATAVIETHDATRREVMRDRRFHLMLPSVLLPPFIITGAFIHQTRLIAEKEWTLTLFAASFVVFAAAQVAGMLGAGPLIDRYGARRIAPWFMLPITVACVSVALLDGTWVAVPFMAGGGLTTGVAMTTVTALWAELYGVKHLGAIRALSVSILIFATAMAPALFGWALELGIRFTSLLAVCAVAGAGATILAWMALASNRFRAD